MAEDPERRRLLHRVRFHTRISAAAQTPVTEQLVHPLMARLFYTCVAEGKTIDEINDLTMQAEVAYMGKMAIKAVIDPSDQSRKYGGMRFIWDELAP